ncbi:MAG: YHS domain-containing protein [Gemmataceae bacterium]|nr:YHS domain-containing protein [Gemmata sp.]MDW8196747.1 YHS domain-containing protein [Gemmataceae bacterium]
MRFRFTCCLLFWAGVWLVTCPCGWAQSSPTAADKAKAKKALQEIHDFIGLWNLEGTQKVGAKTEAWKETVRWGWKFQDGDAWLIVSFADGQGKYFSTGELRYDVAKKKYVLTLKPAEKNATPQQFVGDYTRGMLKLDRTDAQTGDVYRLTMNTAAEGIRFVLRYEKQTAGKGLFTTVYAMNGNKDGESLAGGGAKKPECVVSGGAANIAVQYNGKTYYVCCTGCRDEFLANPQKYAK